MTEKHHSDNLNDRIRRLGERADVWGEALGTNDPLMLEAIILLSRTIADAADAQDRRHNELQSSLGNIAYQLRSSVKSRY